MEKMTKREKFEAIKTFAETGELTVDALRAKEDRQAPP